MGKLLNSLMIVGAIELSMIMFLGITTPTTSLLSLIFNISMWSSSSLIDQIMTWTTAASLGVIALGTLLYKSDFFVFGGIAGLFLSYGMMLMNLKTYIDSTPYFNGTPVSLFIIVPLLIFYLYNIFKFWRGWD